MTISLSTSEARVIEAPEVCGTLQWYAAYTRARHEKRVAEQMQRRSVECFLPLYETVHHWKNGRHQVQLPLFPSYIFARISLGDRLRLLQIPGLVRLVGFGARPTPIPDQDVDNVRKALGSGLLVQPHPYLIAGTRVEVRSGPLMGLTGVVLRRHGEWRVVLSVDLLRRSIVVDLDGADVVSIAGRTTLRSQGITCAPMVAAKPPEAFLRATS